jgi:hypothetical protein
LAHSLITRRTASFRRNNKGASSKVDGQFAAGAAEASSNSHSSNGDAEAFDEPAAQSAVRALMRRLSSDATLAEDLGSRRSWRSGGRSGSSIPRGVHSVAQEDLRERLATHFCKKHALVLDNEPPTSRRIQARRTRTTRRWIHGGASLLAVPVRLCVVLAYQEGMSHGEIAGATGIPSAPSTAHRLRQRSCASAPRLRRAVVNQPMTILRDCSHAKCRRRRRGVAAAVRNASRGTLQGASLEIGVGVLAALGAVALIALAPDTVLYPVQFVQRYVSSPIGAAAGALAAAGLAWWTRFGEI